MHLALFDLDHTLLSCDSDHEWGQHLVEQGALDAVDYARRHAAYAAAYLAGTLDIEDFVRFQLAPLARFPLTTLQKWHADYLQRRIRPQITGAARQLVERHRKRGDLNAVVTATNQFVTAPIGLEFGIDYTLAPQPEVRDGAFTGRALGTLTFGAGKVVRVGEWMAELGHDWSTFETTTFYSDSRNDLPLLERVSHPVVVDPDPVLEAHARQNGWPILSLR